ncbi:MULTISPECIES: hypothetical protein [Petrimonas]|jgi:hypothetical protein|uniref:hypothetical protein n=1 Tax=Petrimonas TaxID=307628 RepID=UPI0008DACEC4|nr:MULTISPECIES: hypothetical protein [Petrimonas]MDD3561399.1 hypothetical protein [Petrimonas mucosa]HHT29545.1 hypothetical protein [Petrimonas mucosa]
MAYKPPTIVHNPESDFKTWREWLHLALNRQKKIRSENGGSRFWRKNGWGGERKEAISCLDHETASFRLQVK